VANSGNRYPIENGKKFIHSLAQGEITTIFASVVN